MKVLRVGDPHAKVNNLDEMGKLMSFVLETAQINKVERIELLGDLFHTHAVLRLEVQEFWNKWLLNLSSHFHTVVLVGNHDMSGNYSSNFSSLHLFKLLNQGRLDIVETPTVWKYFGYVPYFHNHADFIAAANGLADNGCTVLVCHQTLQGSRYESGFYSEDGIPTSGWAERFTHVISGHIHSEQSFENIIYPGTARWDTLSDANVRKGIWIYEHDDNTGKILAADFHSTEHVCSPLKSIVYREGDNAPSPWADNERVTLELVGSSEWILQQKIAFKGKASFKTKITDNKKLQNRKAGRNFQDFIQNVFSSSNKENLLKVAKEIGLV